MLLKIKDIKKNAVNVTEQQMCYIRKVQKGIKGKGKLTTMGMAASQVRFLSLQNRKNSIGRQLSALSNRKMMLAHDMKNVSRNYTNALNQTNLKWSNDFGANYHSLTYDMLMKPNAVNTTVPYILTNANNGKVILNNSALYTVDTMFSDAPETLKATSDIKIGSEVIAASGTDISYITLAKMISSFQSVDDKGNPVYNTSGAYTTNVDGQFIGQPGATDGYYIPDTVDFNFKNNLRYQLFQILGLVTEEDVKTQQSMLVQLYGSEEAKNTGIYPVGSAWGDYYIAQAQLEAYEEFLATEHPYALGDTYGLIYSSGYVPGKGSGAVLGQEDSANAIATDEETIQDYFYSTEINGKDGASTVTQETYKKNGALTHVNFDSAIDNIGGYYTLTDSTGVSYAKYHQDFSGYAVDVSADKITGTYNTTENLLDEALSGTTYTLGSDPFLYALTHRNELKKADGSFVPCANGDSRFGIDSNGCDHGADSQYSGSVVFIGNYRKHSYYSEVKENPSQIDQGTSINAGLETMCNQFYALLQNINSTDQFKSNSANDACANAAKIATINYLKENCNHIDHVDGDNQKNFENSKAMALASGHGLGSWGSDISGHRDHVAVAVDTAVAFDVYMTFFKNYQREYELTGVGPTGDALFIDPDHPTIVDNTPDSISEFDNSLEVAGSNLIDIKSGFTDTNGRSYALSTMYTVQNTMPTSGSYRTVYSQADGSFTYTATGITGESTCYAIPNGEQFKYYCDSTNKVASSTPNTFDGKSVYGTVITNEAYYYFTTKDAAESYRTGAIADLASYTGTGLEKIARTAALGANPPAFDTTTPYLIDLEGDYRNDKYDTYANVAYKDNGFLAILKQAVQDAKDRISELEENLENFYGDKDQKIMDYYDAMFLRIAEQGWEEDKYTKNDLYLNNKIQNNDFFLTECLQKTSNTGFNYTAKQATNIIKIFTVHDENAENEALADYEAKKSEIQYKENVIDTRMAKLETEQEAINTEMDGIQKVCTDNIDKTFKIFA